MHTFLVLLFFFFFPAQAAVDTANRFPRVRQAVAAREAALRARRIVAGVLVRPEDKVVELVSLNNTHLGLEQAKLVDRIAVKRAAAYLLYSDENGIAGPVVYVHSRKAAGSTTRGIFAYHQRHGGASDNRFALQEEADEWPSNVRGEGADTINLVKTTLAPWNKVREKGRLPQKCRRCYFSIGRDPYARVVSLYHYRQCQGIWGNVSFAEFLRQRRDASDHPRTGIASWTLQLCGTAHRCRSDPQYALQEAKRVVTEEFAFVGVVDMWDECVWGGTKPAV